MDYAAETAKWAAREMLSVAGMGDFSFRRCIFLNVWRTFSPPPQDWPMALCDKRSLEPNEGVEFSVVNTDVPPNLEDVPETLPPDPNGRNYHRYLTPLYRPGHRWYYFPNMTRDEVLVFMQYDSLRSAGGRVPHASFHDRTFSGLPPRESIDIRALAYFA
jgi:hypothetical protein